MSIDSVSSASESSQVCSLEREPLLTVSRLSVVRNEQAVLSDINFSLSEGELMAIVGPNGAGKTTLLSSISAELAVSTGNIHYRNLAMASMSIADRAVVMSVLPQRSSLQFSFLVREVVGMGRFPHSSGALIDSQVIDAALQMFDLQSLAERDYLTLSGGERQRVQIARAVCQLLSSTENDVVDHALLLLDEPLAALDLLHQTMVMETLSTLCRQGLSVILVIHDINVAAAYG